MELLDWISFERCNLIGTRNWDFRLVPDQDV